MYSHTKIKYSIAFLLLIPFAVQSQIKIPVKSTAGPAESGSGVSSFNSRTGAVSPVEADYSAYFPSISRFLDSLSAIRNSISVEDNSITNVKLADMAGNTIKGRLTTTGDPQDLTVAQVKTLLSIGRGAEWEMVEDFYSGYLSSNFILFNGNGGTATAAAIYATDQRGNARLSTGNSSASAYSHLTTYDNSFTFNATTYVIDVKDVVISDLNTGSDSSAYLIGFWDNLFSNGNPGDGAYIAYVQTEGTWRCVTSLNGAMTVTSSGVNVGAGYANSIDLEIQANSTQVLFYIGGVLRATHTTNIPTGTDRTFSMGIGIKKKLGTATRTMDVDRIMFRTIN